MANPKDFTARQIRTSQLIASGGIGGTSCGLIIYSASISTDMRGGFPSHLLEDPDTGQNAIGEDVYFFVSGSKNSMSYDGGSLWTVNGAVRVTSFIKILYCETSSPAPTPCRGCIVTIGGDIYFSDSSTVRVNTPGGDSTAKSKSPSAVSINIELTSMILNK